MEATLEKIRDQQKATWNKFSSGWEKWNDFTMEFLQPMGHAMIDYLSIKETDQVLDIATGTGEPGLTIAGLASRGSVTATDLSEDMLTIAAKTARSKKLTNYETRMADCCELPFPDNHFDVISCRMGFMFFPDINLAAREMVRVLKPGGRMATSVWGPADKNPWIARMMKVLAQNIEVPAPLPGAPGMFRCSKPEFMTEMLKEAGFVHIRNRDVSGTVNFGSPERFWENMNDVAAPVIHAMSNADVQTKEKIHQDALAIFENNGGKAALDFSSTVYYGEKP